MQTVDYYMFSHFTERGNVTVEHILSPKNAKFAEGIRSRNLSHC
jgi:hypothetical protein